MIVAKWAASRLRTWIGSDLTACQWSVTDRGFHPALMRSTLLGMRRRRASAILTRSTDTGLRLSRRRTFDPGRRLVAVAAVVVASGLVVVAPAGAASCSATHWVGSWIASPSDALSSQTMTDQTIRMIIAPHLGGTRLRLHLSNRFGSGPITLGPVTIGIRGRGAALVSGSRRTVRFSGGSTVTIPAGHDVVSDPATLKFKSFQELAISVTVTGTIAHPTEHYTTDQTNFLAPAGSGNQASDISGAAFTTTLVSSGWYFLDGLDVVAPAHTGAVVTFGDSITDGFQGNKTPVVEELSSINKNGRYPDDLQRRLNQARDPLSVLNAGISGNRVLQGPPSIFGPSGLSRFRTDALSEPGVSDVIVLEGINDIGQTPGLTASQLITGYRQLIRQAHAAHVAIQLGTLTPSGGTIIPSYGDAAANTLRNTVNHWIRTQRLSNGTIDFDAAVRDPSNPSIINPRYDGSDHLHFDLAGYREMAKAVNLTQLTTPTCTPPRMRSRITPAGLIEGHARARTSPSQRQQAS